MYSSNWQSSPDYPITTRTQSQAPPANKKTSIAAFWLAALLLAITAIACGSGGTGDVNTGTNQAPANKEEEKPKTGVMGQDSVTLKDGFIISVSAPTTFTPNEWSAGTIAGGKNIKFNVTLKNGSTEVKDATLTTIKVNSSAGAGSEIYDSENGLGGTSNFDKMAPDQVATVTVGFSLPAGTTAINVNVQPGFGDTALFTGAI